MRIVGQFTFFEGECYYEKNISAEQDKKTENLWFSGSFQDQEWPGHPAPQKSEGKKEISSLAFPKECRITKRPHFLECYDRGPKQLAGSVKDLFGRYRNGEVDSAPTDKMGQDVVQTMQTAFVQKIQTLSESAGFNLTYTA